MGPEFDSSLRWDPGAAGLICLAMHCAPPPWSNEWQCLCCQFCWTGCVLLYEVWRCSHFDIFSGIFEQGGGFCACTGSGRRQLKSSTGGCTATGRRSEDNPNPNRVTFCGFTQNFPFLLPIYSCLPATTPQSTYDPVISRVPDSPEGPGSFARN